MSIIEEGSVLIVGAGVSTQFGLPLGGDLLTEIANKLKRELKVLQGMRYNNQHIQNLFHEKNNYPEKCFNPVSYTHLTLPTKRIV